MKRVARGLEERRLVILPDTKPELRTAGDGKPKFLDGYGSIYNRYSQNLGGFVEQVDPEAFTRTLQTADVMGLFNHDPSMILGRTSAGTMKLKSDSLGLPYSIELPDTTAGRDTAVYAKRGDVTGSSFSFRTLEDDWSETEQGFPLRTLRQVELIDVGPVTFPAYLDTGAPDARVALRSLAGSSRSLDDLVRAAKLGQLGHLLRGERSAPDDMFFSDIREIVADAIADNLALADDVYLYIADISDNLVVYEIGSDLFRIAYSIDDNGAVTFDGEAEEVIRKTTYETAPADPGRAAPTPEITTPVAATSSVAVRQRLLQLQARR